VTDIELGTFLSGPRHHCGKLSVWAGISRLAGRSCATPHGPAQQCPSGRPGTQGAKETRLRRDRGCPKPRRHVESGQSSAEIIGECRQRTAMHMAAVVQMTVIDIEFAD
jgi:hypothetical protein